MKKYCILLLSVLIALTLNSCFEDNPTTPTKTSHWKQTGRVIWWMYRVESSIPGDVAWSKWENATAFPYGATYTKLLDGDLRRFALIGAEYNLTVSDSSSFWPKVIVNYTWDPLPTKMNADELYDVGAQVKGGAGGINITNPYKANPYGSNDWSLATDDHKGKTFGKVKIAKPIDVTKPDQMAIMVLLSTSYAAIQYTYVYDWVTE